MKTRPIDISSLIAFLLAAIIASGCEAGEPAGVGIPPAIVTPSPKATATLIPLSTATSTPYACPVTEPQWLLTPEDSAVNSPPAHGHYFVNDDRSIWASAGWQEPGAYEAWGGDRGIKVGWFRPEGATLEITGRSLDAAAPPLDSHVPCCYPTRFQSSGLIFPTKGCWEITARAADSKLTFVVYLEP